MLWRQSRITVISNRQREVRPSGATNGQPKLRQVIVVPHPLSRASRVARKSMTTALPPGWQKAGIGRQVKQGVVWAPVSLAVIKTDDRYCVGSSVVDRKIYQSLTIE